MRFLVIVLILVLVCPWAVFAQSEEELEARAQRALNDYLNIIRLSPASLDPNSPILRSGLVVPQGTTLLSLDLNGDSLTLNFNPALLDVLTSDGAGQADLEEIARRFFTVVEETLGDRLEHYRYYEVLVDGKPLADFLPEPAPINDGLISPQSGDNRIVISAGHGLYVVGRAGRLGCDPANLPASWDYQRPCYFEMWEDALTPEFAQRLLGDLEAYRGVQIYSARAKDKAGLGESGVAAWLESGRQYLKSLSLPSNIWDSGGSHYDEDINSRPFYANYLAAQSLINLHTNGGGGRGSEVWFDTGHAAAAQSEVLANAIYQELLTSIRRDYDPNWRGRGVKGVAGLYGETRLARMPAVIVEVGFHDNAEDIEALTDPRFQEIVSGALSRGVAGFLGLEPLPTITPWPGPPNKRSPGVSISVYPRPEVESLSPTLSWQAVDSATHYAVYVADVLTRQLVYSNEQIRALSITLPSGILSPTRVYRWNVVAKRGSEEGSYSNLLYFKTPVNPPPPLQPRLIPLGSNCTVGAVSSECDLSVGLYDVENYGALGFNFLSNAFDLIQVRPFAPLDSCQVNQLVQHVMLVCPENINKEGKILSLRLYRKLAGPASISIAEANLFNLEQAQTAQLSLEGGSLNLTSYVECPMVDSIHYPFGDVDRSKERSEQDVKLILALASGEMALENNYLRYQADIDASGKVDLADALLLAQRPEKLVIHPKELVFKVGQGPTCVMVASLASSDISSLSFSASSGVTVNDITPANALRKLYQVSLAANSSSGKIDFRLGNLTNTLLIRR
ncbi:MAG: N-acetylmuramoyl-L-alanine amidase [Deinococcales bacterium]